MNWLPRPADGRAHVAPSLLSADFSDLESDIADMTGAGADLLHLDVMDGHFVPNITFGPFICRAIRRVSDLPPLWRELRAPWRGRNQIRGAVWLVLTALAICILYAVIGDHLDGNAAQVSLVCLFLVIGMDSTAVRAATCITTEKETRSWPILLAAGCWRHWMGKTSRACHKTLREGRTWSCIRPPTHRHRCPCSKTTARGDGRCA